MDDRRQIQQLEEQVKVITAVCKKLNQDIEVCRKFVKVYLKKKKL